MEELNVNMLSLGCGDCEHCAYHKQCREYSDHIKFVMGVGKRCGENEGA